MSSATYQLESFKAITEDLKEIITIHHEEIGIYNDKLKLSVMWDKYYALEDADMLRTITARSEGKLIGYYICVVQPHLHYAERTFSINDVLYIHPDYRKGFTGIRLIKEAEKCMREEGVDVMVLSFKTYSPFDKILERLSWDYTEKVYTKYLGDGNGS